MYKNVFIQKGKSFETVHLWDDEKGYSKFPYKRYAYRYSPGGKYKSIYGHDLEKVKKWSEDDKNIFEGDVQPEVRTLIDLYGNSDDLSKNITILTFDIEVKSDAGFPVVAKANNPITAISLHDTKTNIVECFILDEKNKIDNKLDKPGVVIRPFDNEINLLESFLSKWEEISPDIITGWNIEFFDIPYIINRVKRLFNEKETQRLSPIKFIRYNEKKEKYIIAGVSCIDYLELYKKFSGKVPPNYRLDTIAKLELGKGKIKFDGSLNDLYDNDINTFLDYNIEDTKLVVSLEDKIKLIELARRVCHTCHVPYEYFYSSSRFLEGAILTDLRRKGLVAPNKPEKEEEDEKLNIDNLLDVDEDDSKFEGAYVKDPIPGKYEWIYDLDLQSLYPSIMMTLNISPETKVDKIEDWNYIDFASNKLKEVKLRDKKKTISIEEFKKIIEEKQLSISASGSIYRTSKLGIIPDILERWFKTRAEYRKKEKEYGLAKNEEMYKFYNSRQIAQKVLLNSMYGVLGLKSFRFYDLDNAEGVTLTGQAVIKTTEKIVNQYYNKVLNTDNKDYTIYIDTDSVFVSSIPILQKENIDLNDTDAVVKRTLSLATEVQKIINESYNIMSPKLFNCKQHKFLIKQEVIAKSGLWLKKKKYTQWLINKGGIPVDEMEIKGIDVVRSSFPVMFGQYLRQLLIDILHNKDKKHIDAGLLEIENKIQNVPIVSLAKNTSVHFVSGKGDKDYNPKDRTPFTYVKATPAQTKAVLFYNDLLKYYKLDSLYEPIYNGDKIKWVYISDNSFGSECIAMKADKDPPEILNFIEKYVDRQKMFDNELLTKVKYIYNALGWEIPSKHEETANNLFNF